MPKKKKNKEKTKKILIRLTSSKDSEHEAKNFFLTVLKAKWPRKHQHPGFTARLFRQVLSNEKARILHVLKTKKKKIKSIYGLAKELNRDFKAVRQDIKLLEHFGFVRLIPENKNGKKRLKPVLAVKKIEITIDL